MCVKQNTPNKKRKINTLTELAACADYSLMAALSPDPQATEDGVDHVPRQVFSGHYVPVKPTPIADPVYVAHSKTFFRELGLNDGLAQTEDFMRLFSGEVSHVPEPMRQMGWATGYALSIYGTEYVQQCPFRTGNGYGDGRAVSVLEAVINGKRWEMQLKGGGPTPYCRGADGRAVLRSSVREFLAQEYMHALGVPTSRSLTLYVSQRERVDRPWYSAGSCAFNPDRMVSNPVAIATRVAPSFLRVGQLELFARRVRHQAHPKAMAELEQITLHLIEREYQIDPALPMAARVIELAKAFRERLTALVADWIRVGYCQGNFNSDNCAAGGFTLDYGPFGFCEPFHPLFQPWTGGGQHFSFLNQPAAAEANYHMFCAALRPLLAGEADCLVQLDTLKQGFASVMQEKINAMWAKKLGLRTFDEALFTQLIKLMFKTEVDYTLFFRELSGMPEDISPLKRAFYGDVPEDLDLQWSEWLGQWQRLIQAEGDAKVVSARMKRINPKYAWREWLVVPAYERAAVGDYSLVHELQSVLSNPYDEQSDVVAEKYYRRRPAEFIEAGGVTHYSCSS